MLRFIGTSDAVVWQSALRTTVAFHAAAHTARPVFFIDVILPVCRKPSSVLKVEVSVCVVQFPLAAWVHWISRALRLFSSSTD